MDMRLLTSYGWLCTHFKGAILANKIPNIEGGGLLPGGKFVKGFRQLVRLVRYVMPSLLTMIHLFWGLCYFREFGHLSLTYEEEAAT